MSLFTLDYNRFTKQYDVLSPDGDVLDTAAEYLEAEEKRLQFVPLATERPAPLPTPKPMQLCPYEWLALVERDRRAAYLALAALPEMPDRWRFCLEVRDAFERLHDLDIAAGALWQRWQQRIAELTSSPAA